VKVKNTGKVANAATRLQLSDVDKYADFDTCKPKCDDSNLFGIYLDYPGIGPGKTVTLNSTWVATKAGAVKWIVCVYDGAGRGEETDRLLRRQYDSPVSRVEA
jgi:hypothetical protein